MTLTSSRQLYAVPLLLAILLSSNVSRAGEALIDPPAISQDELRIVFDRGADSEQRVQCLKRIFPFGRAEPRLAPALLKLCLKTDEPGTVRRQVAELLLRGEVPSAMDEVLRMRNDAVESLEWRAECIGLIAFQYGRIKSRDLLNLLWTELDSKIIARASRAFEELVQISIGENWIELNPIAATRLKTFGKRAFESANAALILSACRAVAYGHWPEFLPYVEALASTPCAGTELRLEALRVLTRMNRPESLAVVNTVRASTQPAVARAAREALPSVELAVGGPELCRNFAKWGADGVAAAELALRTNAARPDAAVLRAFLAQRILLPRALSPLVENASQDGSKIMVDAPHRRVLVPAVFAQIRGPLEYILVRDGSDEMHESLLMTTSNATELRAALQSIGIKETVSKRSAGFVALGGTETLVLSVQFALADGIQPAGVPRTIRVPVETLIRHESESWSMPATPWFDAIADQRASRNTAELIALMVDRAAVIQNATPVAETANVVEGAGSFLAHHALTPAKGTACTLVIESVSADAPLPPIYAQRQLSKRELAEASAYPLPIVVRLELARRLAMGMGDAAARKSLLKIVESSAEPTELRQRLAELLINWNTPELYPILKRMLHDASGDIFWRSRVLDILAFDYTKTLREESVDPILEIAVSDPNTQLRSAALACITRLVFSQGWRTTDEERFVRFKIALHQAFESNDEGLLQTACFAFAELRLPDHLPNAERCAVKKDFKEATRAAALWALRTSARPESIRLLEGESTADSLLCRWTALAALPFALTEALNTNPAADTEKLAKLGERAGPALYTFLDRYPKSLSKPRVKQILAQQQMAGVPTMLSPSAAPVAESTSLISDSKTGTFRLKAIFGNETGPAEYVAVTQGSPEEHEALLIIESIPSELDKALRRGGYVPAAFESRVEGCLELNTQSAFGLFVEFESGAGLVRAPVESFLRQTTGYKPLNSGPWVFTGSRMARDRSGKDILRADINRFAIAFTNDADAVLNCASEDALNANVAEGAGSFVFNQPMIPKKGHPCWLVLEPWFKKTVIDGAEAVERASKESE